MGEAVDTNIGTIEDISTIPLEKLNSNNTKLQPIEGEVTKRYTSIFGEDDDDLSNLVTRQSTRVIDGVKAVKDSYQVFMANGYIQALAPETIQSETAPSVGLKIHVALNPDSDDYAEKLLRIANLCLEENTDGKSATFKVVTYSNAKSVSEYDPEQAKKYVTIYPNYLNAGKTNVPETIRLVSGLRGIMGEEVDKEDKIHGEHKAGNGIFLRAGAFTKKGYNYESISKNAPFNEQVKGNLSSPETDGDLFATEITTAIKSGSL